MAKKTNHIETELEIAAKATEAVIAAQKKVRILIPADPKNKTDMNIEVGINGCFFNIPRGESVEVPESVAAVLMRAKYI